VLPSLEARANAEFRRRTVTPDEVARVLGLQILDPMEYDALRIYRYRPHVHQVFEWAEHPGGRWTRVTNGEGAREDHEFPEPPPDDFVLVAGDSQTDGVCENPRSYANLLEAELAARRPGRRVEVYNTGVSGYSFYNYLGVLEAHLARNPDVFVAAIFAGNDFVESIRIQHLFAGTVPPPRSPEYAGRIVAARRFSPTALTQGLNQILYFRENPDQAELALRAALQAADAMQQACSEHGTTLIVAYLPSAFDLSLSDQRELKARAADALELSEADFEIANRLGDSLLATLRERGVVVVDLRPVFRAQSEPLYWSDLHVNLRGQSVVAEALLAPVSAALR
jgi:hypothetical protein